MTWLVLLWTFPSGGSSTARVGLWRRLKRLGALTLPGGAAILPDAPDPHEQLTWLRQEVEQAGGEAALLTVQDIEGLSDAELQGRFTAARTEDYQDLQAQLDDLTATQNEAGATVRARLDRLRRRAQEIERTDFFQAPAGAQVRARLARLDAQLQGRAAPTVPRADPAQYQGLTWSTRPQPRIDRLSSGWLIRRFIDPQATLAYTDTPGPDDVSFDRAQGGFTHVGPLCTFEVLLQAFDMRDPALRALGEIVHELDVQGPAARPETPGVDALLRGLWAANLSDLDLEAQAHPLFDHLYRALSQEA